MIKLITTVLFLKMFVEGVVGMSMEDESGASESNTFFNSLQVVLLTVAVSCTLILVVLGCSRAWWSRLCSRLRGDEVTENGYIVSAGIMQRDSPFIIPDTHRTSEPISFDPLPSGVDLGLDPRSSFELRASKVPGIVPASNEQDMFASDWFDQKYKNFPRVNIEYVKVVGKGWFGEVIEADAKNIVPFPPKIRVSVKQLRDDASEQEQIRFLNEARMYRDATDANILKMLGHCIETSPYILIMEHLPMGDLKSYLLGNTARATELFNQGILIRMATDIARGLEWMENSGFVHGDLAARNCLIANAAGKVIIGDYGLGTQNYREDYYWSGHIAIPLRWAAPETILCTHTAVETLKVTHKSNIWTFGVVLWEILEFGRSPYYELTDEDVFNRVIEARNYYLERPVMNYASAGIKNRLYNMMVISCFPSNAEARTPITDIIHFLSTVMNT